MKKGIKRIATIFMSLMVIAGMIPEAVYAAEQQDAEEAVFSSAYKNPSSGLNGVTYDCVWFGKYWQDDTNGDGRADTEDEKSP